MGIKELADKIGIEIKYPVSAFPLSEDAHVVDYPLYVTIGSRDYVVLDTDTAQNIIESNVIPDQSYYDRTFNCQGDALTASLNDIVSKLRGLKDKSKGYTKDTIACKIDAIADELEELYGEIPYAEVGA